MIWFDFELMAVITPEYRRRMFADYYNWAAQQPSRVGRGPQVPRDPAAHGHPGLRAGPRGPARAVSLADRHGAGRMVQPTSATPYRSLDNMVHVLVDIVSKNGCMLLDVGPAADGTIPDQARKMLLAMGDWLAVNGEAIYGTRPWLVYGEGPTQGQGRRIQRRRDKAVHPAGHPLHHQGRRALRHRAGLARRTESSVIRRSPRTPGSVPSVSLLGHAGPLGWRQGQQGLEVTLPAEKPCEHAFTLKILGTGLRPSHPAAGGGQSGGL